MQKAYINNIIFKALIIVLALQLSGCHSTKNTYTGNVDLSGTDIDNTTDLFEELAQSYKSWNDLYIPITLSIESPKKMSISGRATMVYGKDINISLRILGMEVGYVYINDKAIWVVDKFHKYYFTESLSLLLKDYNISLTDIQDLLLGRAIIPGKGIISAADSKDFTFISSDDQWIMTPIKKIKGVDWHYIATKTQPPLLESVSLRTQSTGVMQWSFSEPTNTIAGIADGISTITIPYGSKDIKVVVYWMLNEAKWNTNREIKFSAPNSSYKRLDLENLLKALQDQ